MPTRPSKNVAGKYLEFPPELVEALTAFAEERGMTFRAVVMDACRRHLNFPPPMPAPAPDPASEPLPDAARAPARKARRK
jgi:hypothetical protein